MVNGHGLPILPTEYSVHLQSILAPVQTLVAAGTITGTGHQFGTYRSV